MHPAAEALLCWYHQNARVLPWRSKPEPYRVWVSEIMLQQTRVEAVLGYFDRFIKRLPDARALARVSEDELNGLWQGLGYYSRARNLKRAAQILCDQWQGELPGSAEALRSLPGIGEYTAGAIASIAFGLPEPAVDGNVIRVISRLYGLPGDISQAKAPVRERVRAMQPPEQPGDFNQALMELGALICLPNGAPRCGECPWERLCQAHREGGETRYPAPKVKPARRMEERLVLVILQGDRVLLRKRPAQGLLASLWEFPNLMAGEDWREYLGLLGIQTAEEQPLPRARHVFTHIEWHMRGLVLEAQPWSPPQGWAWVNAQELEQYPLPSAFRAYRRAAAERLGNRE